MHQYALGHDADAQAITVCFHIRAGQLCKLTVMRIGTHAVIELGYAKLGQLQCFTRVLFGIGICIVPDAQFIPDRITGI